ncbi:hypothetical protein [Ectopseudomonas mendocina]|jgi:glucan phosphoethanolaminetransferase (alkaline phosphatase superfamily)|uniref:DUF4345 domain-containing protein n=1 Tax=Ectopseudomonas mendocina TaxID=300 RepID=A0A2R3QIJ3_ECTME|nr:hypothetical protein [Pseudomonas mendocina]AVO51568.1 hypothetical protein C7A17_01910 [Pseudomonas mendocina]
MTFIARHFKWLMLVSGALTATMFYGVVAPQAALESMFGTSFDGQLESIIIRSWSALVGLIGIVMIYGALNERHRVFSASIAALSKAIFVSLVMIYGQKFLGSVAPAIALDLLVIVSTLLFLLTARQS